MGGREFFSRQYNWSSDNSAEVDKGWVKKADTIEELATKIGLEPADLARTVNKWNADMAAGHDTLFDRHITAEASSAYLSQATTEYSAPIATPPYFAVPLHPALLNTQGGPRRNVQAEILDAFGNPIPRLFSSGELGCMWGMIYQGSDNIAEAFVYGRIAGKNAAALSNWDA
jgi:predicted oxidoreductase